MTRKRVSKKNVKVDAYEHKGEKRINNPPVGLVSTATDALNGRTKYDHDPHIDPFLSWAGKREGASFEVQNVSLHVHERIDPNRIIKSFIKEDDEQEKQMSLFELDENVLPLNQAVEFYSHEQDWTNRLIAGDSLLVMNSLLKKEGMAGKVQMIYIDPPYGIKYNSNFQPFLNNRDVKDGKDADIPAEPEIIQAFRDTWELGIHSYLTYLKDRLLLARELLTQSGSVFVQISDENVHHVREIMDEIFGGENYCGLIAFQKTGGFAPKLLSSVYDFLLWYAFDKKKVKYRKLFRPRPSSMVTAGYTWIELESGERRRLKTNELRGDEPLPKGRRFQTSILVSAGASEKGSLPFEFNGTTFKPAVGTHWKTTQEGLRQLAQKNRLIAVKNTLAYVRYEDDFPVTEFNNVWDDTVRSTFAAQKIYVVETSEKVIARCLLMSTDPGDLVLDPTCGSGTTAHVAEKWGRRWITCDTSRVAVTLAKQRLMTSKFDYFKLAHPDEGISSGFEYKTVPHITLKSIANNEPPGEEVLYDDPVVDKTKIRVTGPFTVEAVPSLRTKSFDGNELKLVGIGSQIARMGETGSQALWRDELKATGIRGVGGKKIEFSRVEPLAGTRFIHAEGEIIDADGKTNKRAVISFGPDYGPLEQRQVEKAIGEAREMEPLPDFIVFAAFHFDPEAAKDIDQIDWPGVTILKSQMSVDLLTSDLRKKRSSNQSYWLIGQPDVEVIKNQDGTFKVKVNGFDYYNPVTGEIESGDTSKIAMWFLDTDYDEQSLLPEQVFFTMRDKKRDWTRLAKVLKAKVDEEKLEAFFGTESLPFKAKENKKIAVKIIDNRGIESFVVKELKP